MAANKGVSGRDDAGRGSRRPRLVGMDFLHATRTHDAAAAGRPRLHARELLSLLVRNVAGLRKPEPPRRRVLLHVLTPTGAPAVLLHHR